MRRTQRLDLSLLQDASIVRGANPKGARPHVLDFVKPSGMCEQRG
jgi:hypothetical protein